jgi:hypothetical protein
MKGRSKSPLFIVATAILTVVILSLVAGLASASDDNDQLAPNAKQNWWKKLWHYQGQENYGKYQIHKEELPGAPVIDSSTDCLLCHSDYYNQWLDSKHGKSFDNPFFLDAWQSYGDFYVKEMANVRDVRKKGHVKSRDELPASAQPFDKTDCLSCHAPNLNEVSYNTNEPGLRKMVDAMKEGWVPTLAEIGTGKADPSLKFDINPFHMDQHSRSQQNALAYLFDLTKDGVSCDFCHTITRMPYANDISVNPYSRMYSMNWSLNYEHRYGMRKYGPLAEAPTASHVIRYSYVYANSYYCAPCHQEVNNYGLVVQDTYNEWVRSPQAAQNITCQSCHMPQYAGISAYQGPSRERVPSHKFLGTLNPDFMKTAAKLDITAERSEGVVTAKVKVTNLAGHNLPTGLPFGRAVLVTRAEDESGNIFFEELRTYERVVGRSSDLNIDEVPYWRADTQTKDTTLKAGEVREEDFSIDAKDVSGSVFVTTQLFYRRASDKMDKLFGIYDPPTLMYSQALEVK